MKKVITLDIISSTNKLTEYFRERCNQVVQETTCAYLCRCTIIVLTLELAALLKITREHKATHQEVVMLLFLVLVQQECVIISSGNQESTPIALKSIFHPPRQKFVNL